MCLPHLFKISIVEIKRAGKLLKILCLPMQLKTILLGKKMEREVKKSAWLHKDCSAVG